MKKVREDREQALGTKETTLSDTQGGATGLQKDAVAQKALKRFQRTNLLELLPSYSQTCTSFSVSWNRGVDKH